MLAGLRGSRGKVLHNDLLLLWASAPFLLAPVAVDVRDRVARRRYGWPIRVAMVITALVYFFAGYHKLRRSGIDWVLGDNMRYVMLWGPSIGEAQLGGHGPLGGRAPVGGQGVGRRSSSAWRSASRWCWSCGACRPGTPWRRWSCT